MKRLKETETVKMQISRDGKKTLRLLVPITFTREIEKRVGREMNPDVEELCQITLLDEEPGIKAVLLKK